jgi:hypothetical protein
VSHFRWEERQFQNFNYDGITDAPTISDSLVTFGSGVSLVRTMLWWDLRSAVDEDHTFQPRAPYPFVFDVYAAPGTTSEPPIGATPDPVMHGMMCTVPTESFGSIIGTEEIQRRLWVGNSGGQPLDSKAQRSGRDGDGLWNMRISIRAFDNTGSPTGAITNWTALFLFNVRFLFDTAT